MSSPLTSEISAAVGDRWWASASDISVSWTVRTTSTMCTGSRMVRPLLPNPRVIAWRIHQVAYVENLNPLRQSNFSTARISPRLPSWMRSSSSSPRPVYRLAIDTTSRRLEAMNSAFASAPSDSSRSKVHRSSNERSGPPTFRAPAAHRPRSIARARRTSSSASRRGWLDTSSRYCPMRSPAEAFLASLVTRPPSGRPRPIRFGDG